MKLFLFVKCGLRQAVDAQNTGLAIVNTRVEVWELARVLGPNKTAQRLEQTWKLPWAVICGRQIYMNWYRSINGVLQLRRRRRVTKK